MTGNGIMLLWGRFNLTSSKLLQFFFFSVCLILIPYPMLPPFMQGTRFEALGPDIIQQWRVTRHPKCRRPFFCYGISIHYAITDRSYAITYSNQSVSFSNVVIEPGKMTMESTARPFARSLTPLTHSLAPPGWLRSRAPLR